MSIDWDNVLPERPFELYVLHPKFERDFKQLLKRYPSLKEDFSTFVETQLDLVHNQDVDNRGTFELTYVNSEECRIFKTKRFACRALAGSGSKSGIRVIHAYYEEEDKVEFVEIYYKGDKPNEDRERIEDYYDG